MAYAKTSEQHLADAKGWTLTNLKVIGPAKQFKDGPDWFILCECLLCGKQQWLAKKKLRYMTSCGCLKGKSKKIVKEPQMELTQEQKDTIDKVISESKATSVMVSRRLVLALAEQTQSLWDEGNFWELPPALFKRLIEDTQELYDALKEQ